MPTVAERLLRTAAILCAAVLLTSWGLFAVDQTRGASNTSSGEIAGLSPAQAADIEAQRQEAKHTQVRRAIDSASDALVSPFDALTDGSSSEWLRRSVPMLVALLLYCFGLGYLARFARGRA